MSRRGFAVQIIARQNCWLDKTKTKGLSGNINIEHIGNLFAKRQLQRALLRFKPDIIHTHLGWSARRVESLHLDVPLVATLHGQYKSKNYSRHDALVCIAPWQRQTISTGFHGEIWDIPNFISHKFFARKNENLTRASLGISANTFVIGAVGRLSKEKGFNTLIQAFIKAELPDSALVIIGDGPEMPRLRRIARENIIFTGWQEDPHPYYRIFDLFASTSTNEAFGLTILDAMQAGLPILATETNGPRWLLRDGAGIIVPIGDISQCARALRKLYENKTLQSNLGAAAKARVSDFSPDRILPRLETCYQHLIIQKNKRYKNKT